MQQSVFILWLMMFWSVAVQANVKITLQPVDSSEFFAELDGQPETSNLSQPLSQTQTLILENALRTLLKGSPVKASNKAIFENLLRSDVRANLFMQPIFQPSNMSATLQVDTVNIEMQWQKETLAQQVAERLKVLDQALPKYLRMSAKSSSFGQLKRLMPALYNIEERAGLIHLLKLNDLPVPPLQNTRLVDFLDKQISRLARGLTFNMKALVREGREFEPDVIASLAQQALTFVARPPDFRLDYQLESLGQDADSGAWVFEGRMALLGQFDLEIASAELSLSETAQDEGQAQRQALDKIAQTLSQNLRAFLLKKH